ncbi:MAG TPA: diguanylate cyclase [Longimicrobiales bacterium]|nr:diguanylate cyclase [Longimicrobiales bacterium]
MLYQHAPLKADHDCQYAVLFEMVRTLTAIRRLDELFAAIHEQTLRLIEADEFYLSLYDRVTDTATVVLHATKDRIERPNIAYRGSESQPIRESRPTLHTVENPERAMLLLRRAPDPVTMSSMAAPLMRDFRLLGIIGLKRREGKKFGQDDLALLATIADVAAIALENARHVYEAERGHREAARLEEIGRVLSSTLDLPRVLERIVAATIDLAQADGVAVWLFRGNDVAEVAMSGGPVAIPTGTVVPLPAALRHRLIRQRESLVLASLRAHPLLPEELRTLIRTDSGIMVPLVLEDSVIGALSVGHRGVRSYQQEDIRLLERLSYHAAIAVANARLHEQIRLLSLTDPLTGLANRRRLSLFLETEFAAARRGRPLSIVIFDLDNFKHYNDTKGHQAGDAAIIAFARILARETRAMNLAARYGGDEFIAVLAGSDREGALNLAKRISELVEQDKLLGPSELRVTAGVASYSPEMESPEDLIRAADHELYRLKGMRKPASKR